MKTVSPSTAPIIQEVAAVPERITGFRSTARGRNGSGDRLSHQTKATPSASDTAVSAKMVGDTARGCRRR